MMKPENVCHFVNWTDDHLDEQLLSASRSFFESQLIVDPAGSLSHGSCEKLLCTAR